MIDRKRKSRAVPCAFTVMENGRLRTAFPDVDCKHECLSCGWNPAEKKRRLENGRRCEKIVFQGVAL